MHTGTNSLLILSMVRCGICLTSIVFFILKPTLPLQDKLSQIFEETSALLQAKARLF